ncbi:MAG TPA: hypothetical protein PLA50_02015, partial [Bacteroidia bacterium]|nr:hypothetical protein [Bacteroidia bacterium]
ADDEAKPELGDGDDGVYERIEYHYNRVGQQTRMKDPNGTIHDYEFNQLGQLLHDRVTTLAAHIDGGVRRISLAYNARRQVETVGSYSSALVGHGTLLNQVKRDYNGFGQMVADWQEHDG